MKPALRNLIRFLAVALFLLGALLAGLELMRRGLREHPLDIGNCVLSGGLLIGGVILFPLSSRIADHFTDDDDDDSNLQIPPQNLEP